jgi:hypothetical protein
MNSFQNSIAIFRIVRPLACTFWVFDEAGTIANRYGNFFLYEHVPFLPADEKKTLNRGLRESIFVFEDGWGDVFSPKMNGKKSHEQEERRKLLV